MVAPVPKHGNKKDSSYGHLKAFMMAGDDEQVQLDFQIHSFDNLKLLRTDHRVLEGSWSSGIDFTWLGTHVDVYFRCRRGLASFPD